MKTSALVQRPGEWRLLHQVSARRLARLIESGWQLTSTWPDPPSVVEAQAAVRQQVLTPSPDQATIYT